MATANMTQGQKIRSARLAAGLTQAQLARAIETSERNIVRWESDRNAPRFVLVIAIARATGQDVSYFESGSDEADDDEEADLVAVLHSVLRGLVRDEIRKAERV